MPFVNYASLQVELNVKFFLTALYLYVYSEPISIYIIVNHQWYMYMYVLTDTLVFVFQDLGCYLLDENGYIVYGGDGVMLYMYCLHIRSLYRSDQLEKVCVVFYMYDWLIDWIEFYVVSAIFHPCKGGIFLCKLQCNNLIVW